eukprot:4721359-Prymnesium_polylepis.1
MHDAAGRPSLRAPPRGDARAWPCDRGGPAWPAVYRRTSRLCRHARSSRAPELRLRLQLNFWSSSATVSSLLPAGRVH